jgi:hypothetical protein
MMTSYERAREDSRTIGRLIDAMAEDDKKNRLKAEQSLEHARKEDIERQERYSSMMDRTLAAMGEK